MNYSVFRHFISQTNSLKLLRYNWFLVCSLIISVLVAEDIVAQSPALEVEGNGVLFPRFTSQERDSIMAPEDGLTIYNTDTKCLEVYRDIVWYSLCDGGQVVTRGLNLLLGGIADERPQNIQSTSDGGFIFVAQTESSASGDISSTNQGGNDIWIVKLNGYGVVIWEKLIGGDGFEGAPIIRETHDNGFIIVSTSKSSANGDVTDASNGLTDLWLVKLDIFGNIIWNKLLGGNSDESAHDIEQTFDGGYIILARSYSSANGNVTDSNNGQSDYWVVKVDDLGNIVWNKLYGGISIEHPAGIQQTLDGGYVVSGYSFSSNNGDVTEVNHGNEDFWVLKLDSLGNKLWDRLLGGNGNERCTDILQTEDEGYIVVGNSSSSTSGDVMGVNHGVTGSNPGSFDWWVVRLDSLGNIQWGKLLGGSGYDGASEIRQTIDGGFVIIGDAGSSQSGDVAQVNNGLKDGWIAKVDGLGNLIWEKLLGGDDQEFFESLCQTSEGSLILLGHTKSSTSGDITLTNHGGIDVWIIKVDKSGNLISE